MSGASDGGETKPGPNQPFGVPVVLVSDVAEVFGLTQPAEAPQVAAPLHLGYGFRGSRIFVHRDHPRISGVRLRLVEEPFGAYSITPNGEQKVDALTKTVDRVIQIGPNPLDLDVSLIHTLDIFRTVLWRFSLRPLPTTLTVVE